MKLFLSVILLTIFPAIVHAITVSERVEAAEKNIEGSTFQATATMTVKRDGEERNLKMKMWWQKPKHAFVRILEPKRDKGTGSLRIGTDLWQYLPKVNRIVRVPSSMMLQSWMGSDFSNDDLVRGGSLFRDYTHKELAKEKVGTHQAVKIECTPKPNVPVVWGSVIVWVRESDNAPLQHEYYSEHGKILKKMSGEDIVTIGKHAIPTKLTMTNLGKNGASTTIVYDRSSIVFDAPIAENIFTQENLRRP